LSSFEGEGGIAVETTAILRWCPRRLLDLINSKACRGELTSAHGHDHNFLTVLS
jgi:hypothetical protein